MRQLLLPTADVKSLGVFLLFLFFTSYSAISWAQRVVRGVVTEALSGEPLAGVTVSVKGKTKHVITGSDGKYVIELERREAMLVFSLPGFRPKESEAALRTIVNVQLEEDLFHTNTDVTTAAGITAKSKQLGYNAQHLSARELDCARDINFLNTLAAKSAGLHVVAVPSGLGSSSWVTLRGQRSLNLTANQPLYIMDGVPVSNQFFGSFGRGYQDADYGNGAGFLNPDDMESVTILKGANAAAFWGARGSHGAIAITTRTGKNTRGIGVSFNSSVLFESPLRLPAYQNQYGQGLEGQFRFADGNGGGLNDATAENWGPAFSGQRLPQFDSPTSKGRRGGDVGNLFRNIGPVNSAEQLEARGMIDSTLWQAYPNNVRDFFETGVTQSYHLAVAGGNERGDFRLAYTFANQKGMLPNTGLQRNYLTLTGGYELSERIKARATIHYLRGDNYNRPTLGEGSDNVMFLFNGGLPRSTNIESLRSFWQSDREGQNQFNFIYRYHNNPYFNLIGNENTQQLDRLFGNTSLQWQLKPWLNLIARLGADVSNEFRARKRSFSGQNALRGSYREEKIAFEELNADLMLRAEKEFSPVFNFSSAIGVGNMQQNLRLSDLSASELTLPNTFNLSNSRLPLESYSLRSEKRIQSLYAFANFRWQQFLHLDLTTRNDWLSALPRANRSVLSYGGSLSMVLSEAFKTDPDGLSLAQLRLSYARTGSDPNPYQLQTIYIAQTPVGDFPAAGEAPRLAKPDLQSEMTTAFEAGFDARFLNNRIALDVAGFQTTTDRQILSVPLSIASGYTSRVINAGVVRNRGLEVVLDVIPIETKGFRWQIGINWALWRGKVLRLGADSLAGSYVLFNRYLTAEARPNARVGDLYGSGYQRVSRDAGSSFYDSTGTFVGQIVFDNEGKPLPTAEPVLLGNFNPEWIAGFSSIFAIKRFSLYLLFDIRRGGIAYSRTRALGLASGTLIETLNGRANGYNLTQEGNGIVGRGVIKKPDGTFSENTVRVSAREWYNAYTLNRPIDEALITDASFIKLRELRLSFHLPSVWLGKSRIRNAIVAIVGRNLLVFNDQARHIDPEIASINNGMILPGVEVLAIPAARSLGFNLSFKF